MVAACVGVVLDIEGHGQRRAVSGLAGMAHRKVGLGDAIADVGDGEVIASRVETRGLCLGEVGGVVGVDVVVAFALLDEREPVASRRDLGPVDRGAVQMLGVSHVDPAQRRRRSRSPGLAQRARQPAKQGRRVRGTDVEPSHTVHGGHPRAWRPSPGRGGRTGYLPSRGTSGREADDDG